MLEPEPKPVNKTDSDELIESMKVLSVNLDTFSAYIKNAADTLHPIQNAETKGQSDLVSKEEMFEFAKWYGRKMDCNGDWDRLFNDFKARKK